MIPIVDIHSNAKIHEKWELLSSSCPQLEISILENVVCFHHADIWGMDTGTLGQKQEILLGGILALSILRFGHGNWQSGHLMFVLLQRFELKVILKSCRGQGCFYRMSTSFLVLGHYRAIPESKGWSQQGVRGWNHLSLSHLGSEWILLRWWVLGGYAKVIRVLHLHLGASWNSRAGGRWADRYDGAWGRRSKTVNRVRACSYLPASDFSECKVCLCFGLVLLQWCFS